MTTHLPAALGLAGHIDRANIFQRICQIFCRCGTHGHHDGVAGKFQTAGLIFRDHAGALHIDQFCGRHQLDVSGCQHHIQLSLIHGMIRTCTATTMRGEHSCGEHVCQEDKHGCAGNGGGFHE